MCRGIRLTSLIIGSVSFLSDHGISEANVLAWCLDDIELVKGMPICLQIVGGRFGEEKAVAVAKAIDEVVKGTQ